MGRKLPDIIQEKEFLEIMKGIKNRAFKVAVVLGFYQCMRLSEIAGLKKAVSRCCMENITSMKETSKTQKKCSKCNKVLGVNDYVRSKTEWAIEPLKPENFDLESGFIKIKNAKGGKDRNIPIMKPLYSFRGFESHLPIKMSRRTLQRELTKLVKNRLNKDLSFHGLRHSGLSFYLNVKKIDIRHLQQLAGHSNISSTEIYTHTSPEELKKVFADAW